MAADPVYPTVEALIRHRLGEALGGIRGSIEAALPMLVFGMEGEGNITRALLGEPIGTLVTA